MNRSQWTFGTENFLKLIDAVFGSTKDHPFELSLERNSCRTSTLFWPGWSLITSWSIWCCTLAVLFEIALDFARTSEPRRLPWLFIVALNKADCLSLGSWEMSNIISLRKPISSILSTSSEHHIGNCWVSIARRWIRSFILPGVPITKCGLRRSRCTCRSDSDHQYTNSYWLANLQ